MHTEAHLFSVPNDCLGAFSASSYLVLLTFPQQHLPESNICYGGESTAFFLQPLYFKTLFMFEVEYASSKVLGLQYVSEFSLWMERSSN